MNSKRSEAMIDHAARQERKRNERDERIRKNLEDWAHRVVLRGSFRAQKLRAFDILHDLRGILSGDEQFLPRL